MMMNLIRSGRALLVFAFFIFGVAPQFVRADNEMSVLSALHVAYPEWRPRGIVDVGANSGGWTRAVQAEHLFQGVKTFMVEAFKDNTKYLEDTKNGFKEGIVDYSIAVLSSTDDETIKFHSIPQGFTTGNSIFVEQSLHYTEGNSKVDLLKTAKLDTVLKGKMEFVDYLKLDVQVSLLYQKVGVCLLWF
jgi:FkbM family methyltransferase